jgi:arylsulfatase A-like enzyme
VRYTPSVRRLLPAAALASALALGCSRPLPPNLLLVTVDTLRADRLVCYGGSGGAQICSLFAGGIRFRWAFSAAPYTAPSVASLLTSRYPAYHGVTQAADSYLGNDQATVAELLRSAGYQTAAFVSNPVLERWRNMNQGFDVYDQHMTRHERNRPGYAEREAGATTDAVLAWARVALHEPWFVWVHYQDPHGPYDPPGAVYRPDPPGAARLPVLSRNSGKGGIPRYQALPGTFSLPAYEQRYLDEISYLDPHVERLVRGLEALSRPPAILLTADHGEAFGEDGYYFAHGQSVGLDQIRVPLLYRPPRASGGEGRVVADPVSLLDVAPTLLQLAGVPVPESFQGRPLPLARDAAPDPERTLFAEHGRRAAVVLGHTYYSRDRSTDEGERDRELGEEMPSFPPRVARLGDGDALPPYAKPGPGDAALEKQLGGFLERTSHLRGLRYEEVPKDVQERMRALGYTD